MYHLLKNILASVLLFVVTAVAYAQQEGGNQQEGNNQLDVSLQFLGQGEMRLGGFDVLKEEDANPKAHAYFLLERTRLTIDFKRPHLEAKVTAQHAGVWGEKGRGDFNLYETWVKFSANNGLFAQVGRQALSYDDERIIGPNDWAMAASSHDVLRLGYEGSQHKAHVILAFNQNDNSTEGGTYYADGAQPYKTMQTVWYHYDMPKVPLGASLLFMNIGMQGGEKDGTDYQKPHTRFQQLLGGYLTFNPGKLKTELSYYRQMGRNEYNKKIQAWMTSVKAQYQATPQFNAVAGYDYLSGDKYFAVPGQGEIGLTNHAVFKGFNPVYGSHHKFYGMMDFFYVSTYVNGFSPGLQNLFAGAEYSPVKNLNMKLTYHYLAMATKLKDIDKTLGHDIDLEASWQCMKDVELSLGFSFMTGTESMKRLKRADDSNHLTWGWVTLVVSPKLFSTKW